MFRRLLIAVALGVTGCAPRPVSISQQPAYVVGPPYQQAGIWHYPAERFGGEETGLAVRQPGTRIATDHEGWDDALALGSHATLQLPAIVRVTNLTSGTSLLVRVIDRGPARRGRIIGLSDRAATLLGVDERPAPVRLNVDGPRSQALRDALAPARTGLIAAPRASVQQETLPGAPGALRPALTEAPPPAARDIPLPTELGHGPPGSGQIQLRGGTFSIIEAARLQAGRLAMIAPQIERAGTGRAETYTVRAGPYANAAAADAALDQAIAAGVTDTRIVVE